MNMFHDRKQKRQFQLRLIWQDLRYANGTLEEWVKKSEAEILEIEDEIREIRGLLDAYKE